MHSKAVALVLGILSFIPPFSGLLRFYLKQPLLGVLYTLTAGGLFVGNILDVVQIPELVRRANQRHKRRELEEQIDHGLLGAPGDERSRTEPSADQRPMERVILRSAKENGGCTTASEVALAGDVSIEEARHALDVLVSKGFADMRVSKEGTVVYCIPDILPSGKPEMYEGI